MVSASDFGEQSQLQLSELQTPSASLYPGKRPQSSIASSVAEDLETGEFDIATGAAGESRIITATLRWGLHYTLGQCLALSA